jgi:RNA polymerase sigma-70 factor (ECF subfamily)
MSTSTRAHEALVGAAATGDDHALAALVRAYHDRVYRYGRRACRDRFDADDAVQEAFIKLARRPDVVRHQGALSWLMSVVRRACLRMLRPRSAAGRARDDASDPDGLAADSEGADAALARWGLVAAVHAAIAELPVQYRAVLVLRDLEGLTGAETCVALGLDLAAMKSRLHRARGLLREKLRPQWAEEAQ